MKTIFLLLFIPGILFSTHSLQAQVTQINSNKSLKESYLLSSTRSVYVSNPDKTLWVTDGTSAGTFQLSADITFYSFLGSLSYLNGEVFFEGSTPSTGRELYITDGTPAGTRLVKDINPGAASSTPNTKNAILNGFMYFIAGTATEGNELWRTDGTSGGTTLVMDIVAGTGSGNYPYQYYLFSNNSYLLFMANTPSNGVELWKSDGTSAGTQMLKDIYVGSGSSDITYFFQFDNLVLFYADNAVNGKELWKTDGTAAGTVMVKDIRPGALGSEVQYESAALLDRFVFNGVVYFRANDGVNGAELWRTDGTAANTTLVKDISPGRMSSTPSSPPANTSFRLNKSVKIGEKFIFSVTGDNSAASLWQSDGTEVGTVLFKSFPISFMPQVFVPFNYNPTQPQPLFQGNKFFFVAFTVNGLKLFISDGVDGTATNTYILQTGVDSDGPSFGSYCLTSNLLFFDVNTSAHGRELWKTDGTQLGTVEVADIVPGPTGCDPIVELAMVNNKVLFQATNRDDAVQTDLYAVDGLFNPLPVQLTDFTVTASGADALLRWTTLQEINSRDFTLQRSFNGPSFEDIGIVQAAGSSSTKKNYAFVDRDIINNGNKIIYYRLVTHDMDGKSALSPTVVLKTKSNNTLSVSMLSNPVTDQLKLMLQGVTQNVQLSIFDIAGKKLATEKLAAVNGQVSMPVSHLARGTYLLLVEAGGERQHLKFVK